MHYRWWAGQFANICISCLQVGLTWSCELDGVPNKVFSFKQDSLHALEAPPVGSVVYAPPPTQLLSNHPVPISSLPQYLHNYQHSQSSPCDLQLLHHTQLAYQLYAGLVTPSSLSDEQVLALAYMGDGEEQ